MSPKNSPLSRFDWKLRRPIRVDELFAIAAALAVAPVYLLSGDFTNERVQVTPKITRLPSDVRLWIQGTGALDEETRETFFELVPDEVRLARRWSGYQNMQAIVRQLEAALGSNANDAARDAIADIRTELKWLQQELARDEERAERARKEE